MQMKPYYQPWELKPQYPDKIISSIRRGLSRESFLRKGGIPLALGCVAVGLLLASSFAGGCIQCDYHNAKAYLVKDDGSVKQAGISVACGEYDNYVCLEKEILDKKELSSSGSLRLEADNSTYYCMPTEEDFMTKTEEERRELFVQLYTNPAYYWYPGNIYGPVLNPAYSNMPGNLYYDD